MIMAGGEKERGQGGKKKKCLTSDDYLKSRNSHQTG